MSRRALSGLVRGMGILGVAVLAASGALAADITGRKGLGGSVGTSLMIGDWEYRQHARPRFTGDAVFKYGFMPRWALVGMFGYGVGVLPDCPPEVRHEPVGVVHRLDVADVRAKE